MPRAETVHAVLVNLLCGTIVGISIGFVPVCMQFVEYITDCKRYTDEASCSSLGPGSGCSWRLGGAAAPGYCAYEHWEANCTAEQFSSYDECTAQTHCYYDYKNEECDFIHGWSSIKKGIFAGAMIIGAMVGSVVATPLLRHLCRKKALLVLGIIGTVAAILVTIGWQLSMSYGLMLAGRIFAGVAVGISAVASPIYVGEVAPAEHQGVIGVMFQISVTLGICVAAFIGLVLDPRHDTTGTHHIHDSFHALNAVVLAVPVALIPVALIVRESPVWLSDQAPESGGGGEPEMLNHSGDEAGSPGPSPGLSPDPKARPGDDGGLLARLWRIKATLFAGIMLSAALQLTGINAIMTYAPSITSSFSLSPLVGNFVVMVWNFVTTLISIPLVKFFSPRRMYVVGTLFATAACIFTAVPTYPGVLSNQDAANILGGLGVILFIAAFEIGMGPAYYILAQNIFPAEDRSHGCSMTIWAQFVFNLVINFGYPVAQTAMSGGPSGDQDKGQALCFAIFGGLGVLCSLYFVLLMPKSSSDSLQEGEESNLVAGVEDDDGYGLVSSDK